MIMGGDVWYGIVTANDISAGQADELARRCSELRVGECEVRVGAWDNEQMRSRL